MLTLNISTGCVSKYSDYSEKCRNRVEDLKRNLRSRKAICFTSKPTKNVKAATIASYKIKEIVAKKKKKTSEDGNMIKTIH
jgi:hypothetical protein